MAFRRVSLLAIQGGDRHAVSRDHARVNSHAAFSIASCMALAQLSIAADNEDCHRSHRIPHNSLLPLDNRNGVN